MSRAESSPDEDRTFDADVIIAAWCGAGDRVPLEKIIRDRGWSRTSAAQVAARFTASPTNFSNTPAPTLIQGLRRTGICDSSRIVSSHERNP